MAFLREDTQLSEAAPEIQYPGRSRDPVGRSGPSFCS
jgi:hypothetical protein